MNLTVTAPQAQIEIDRASSWSPTSRELDDLEVLLLGGYGPVRGFLGPDDVAAVTAAGRLADGTPWPVPVSLHVPDEIAGRASVDGALALLDEEGAAVGTVRVTRTWSVGAGRSGVEGLVEPAAGTERGSHRWLCRRATASAPWGRLLGVPVECPLHAPQIAQLRSAARALGAEIMLLPVTGAGRQAGGLDASALVRTCLSAGAELGADVVPVPVPLHDDPDRDGVLLALVAQAYGATHLPGPVPTWPGPLPEPVELPEVVRHRRTGAWDSRESVAAVDRGAEVAADVGAEVQRLVRLGHPVPSWMTGPTVLRELRRSQRQGGPGFTVLLTGLSGSGKSTIGRALHAALLERCERTVTLLDGDIVRRMLSSELSFSRAHRELNVRRIGWVAAEVTRHGGIAVCTPIAPYEDSRAEMRRMVGQHGGFLLVHVATSLETCEARDRKGLYAKARAGELPEFTGVSDPYETPSDADVVIDTARVSVEDAVTAILDAVSQRRWLGIDVPHT